MDPSSSAIEPPSRSTFLLFTLTHLLSSIMPGYFTTRYLYPNDRSDSLYSSSPSYLSSSRPSTPETFTFRESTTATRSPSVASSKRSEASGSTAEASNNSESECGSWETESDSSSCSSVEYDCPTPTTQFDNHCIALILDRLVSAGICSEDWVLNQEVAEVTVDRDNE